MWTPVINNVVVIVVGGLYVVDAAWARSRGHISACGVQLLAIGTTLGVVVQTDRAVPVAAAGPGSGGVPRWGSGPAR